MLMRTAQVPQQEQNPVTCITTNLRRMHTALVDGAAHYVLPLFDVLTPTGTCPMNPLVGRTVALRFAQGALGDSYDSAFWC
jgi:hypothetical protein